MIYRKIQELSANADWLTRSQKEVILREVQQHHRIQDLSEDEQTKLCLVLFSVPFAEYQIKIHGKWLTKCIKDSLLLRPFTPYLCSTLGTWNLHVLHAEKFGLAQKEFRKILLDDSKGIHYVISFVLNYIGLHKPLEYIFAEYNYREMSTTVASLQRLLNLVLAKYGYPSIKEDGIFEEETRKAADFCCSSLQITCSLDLEKGEGDIASLIDTLNGITPILVRPFLPEVKYKRDLAYAKRIIKSSIKHPANMKKLLNLFRNHIDISSYTQFALKACHKLGHFS